MYEITLFGYLFNLFYKVDIEPIDGNLLMLWYNWEPTSLVWYSYRFNIIIHSLSWLKMNSVVNCVDLDTFSFR